jgi:cysteinyl-tRNA synthetase
VAECPFFRSGNLRPEAKLFLLINELIDSWHAIEARIPAGVFDSSLNNIKDKLVESARPAEDDFEAQVRRLVYERDEARKLKNFAESDRIRHELAAMGVVLKDSKDGTTWKRVP